MAITFAVLGDSIAVGVGASRPQDALGPRLVTTLRAAGVDAQLHVFAVSGARSDSLAGQADRAAAIRPDLAVVIIGANDLTHFTPVPVAATQLGDAVRVLRAAGAEVIVVPAPDLSVVPWVPPNLRPVVRAASATLRRAQTAAARAAGAAVVTAPTDLAQVATNADLLSPDRFHPSSRGYAVLAAELEPSVLTAARARRI